MDSRNRNREHAVQQLKKYLKASSHEEAEEYQIAMFANALIYIGDSLATISKSFTEAETISIDDRDSDIVDMPEED